MSNSGSFSGKGVRFVSSNGNANLTVSDGKVSQLDLEIIDSKFSHKEQRQDRREEHVSDVMSVLESQGQAGAETGANPFGGRKVNNAPDPNALLAFIDQAKERDDAAEEAKNPKFVVPGEEVDTEAIINQDAYLSDLIGAQLNTSSGEADDALLDMLEMQTQEHLAEAGGGSAAGKDAEIEELRYDNELAMASAKERQEDALHDADIEKSIALAELAAEKDDRIAELEAKIAEFDQVQEGIAQEHSEEIARLQTEAEQDADEAYKKGMEEGAANRQEEVDALQEQISQISQEIPTGLNNYFEELEAQMKEEICTFSLSIAESFIKREIGDRDVLKETVKNALAPIINYKGVTLFLNPQIAELAQSGSEFNLPNGLKVEGDPQLEIGEAFVETDMGFIDATLSRRLDSLRESFDKPSGS